MRTMPRVDESSLDLQLALAVRLNTLAERAQELIEAVEEDRALRDRFAAELRSVREALIDLSDVMTLAKERRIAPEG